MLYHLSFLVLISFYIEEITSREDDLRKKIKIMVYSLNEISCQMLLIIMTEPQDSILLATLKSSSGSRVH
jgi:hypothetical protein